MFLFVLDMKSLSGPNYLIYITLRNIAGPHQPTITSDKKDLDKCEIQPGQKEQDTGVR